MKYVLFNALSDNKQGEKAADVLIAKLGDVRKLSVIGLDYVDFLGKLDASDEVYLVGGDGTLNIFANAVYGKKIAPALYFCPAGSGNDFMNDVQADVKDGPVDLKKYIKNLPVVFVNGEERRFINGIGFGLDGVCCEIGDEKRTKSDKPVNYSAIAVKLLLFKYKPRNATVTVDGKTIELKNVWIAPSMKGRYYGGGMMVAPRQDRFAEDGSLTFVGISSKCRLKVFMAFPKIFSGKHENNPMVTMMSGKEITVKFDAPCALQVDGETFLNVTEYTVKADK